MPKKRTNSNADHPRRVTEPGPKAKGAVKGKSVGATSRKSPARSGGAGGAKGERAAAAGSPRPPASAGPRPPPPHFLRPSLANAFRLTELAADAWAEAARCRPTVRGLGVAAGVVAAAENALRQYDLEFLGWTAHLGSGPRERSLAEATVAWCGGDPSPVEAISRAADAWAGLAQHASNNSSSAMIAAVVTAIEGAIRRADEPMLSRIWTWAYGTQLRPDARRPRSSVDQRLLRLDDPAPLRALSRAAAGLADAATSHPHDPVVGLVAQIVTSVESAILDGDRPTLTKLKECLAPSPVAEVLRARELPVPERLLRALADDTPVRAMLHAADEWERGASRDPTDTQVDDHVALVVALTRAMLASDTGALAPFVKWARAYVEKSAPLATHGRSVHALRLAAWIEIDFEAYRRRVSNSTGQEQRWWSVFVVDTVSAVIESLPSAFGSLVQPDLSQVVFQMTEQLDNPKERDRLCGICNDEGLDVLARAVAVSALKANEHTRKFADNLFAFERMQKSRKLPE